MSYNPRCPICSKLLDSPWVGRKRRYCSNACRQRAYRERKARYVISSYERVLSFEEDRPDFVTRSGLLG